MDLFFRSKRKFIVLLIFSCLYLFSCQKKGNTSVNKENDDKSDNIDSLKTTKANVLLIVFDGLRPDYITNEYMPNLYSMGMEGFWSKNSFSAFPTETRVNAATISTGSYPTRHGLMGNYMWNPDIDSKEFSTGEYESLQTLGSVSGGRILTASSMAEILNQQGLNFFAGGTSGTGTGLLMNPGEWRGGIVTTSGGGFFKPESNQEILNEVGPIPSGSNEKVKWAFDVYIHNQLSNKPADVATIWIGQSDAIQHSSGVGSPQTINTVKIIDSYLGDFLNDLKNKVEKDVDIFITADHGFSTSTGNFLFSGLKGKLRDFGISDSKFVVSHEKIYLNDKNDQATLQSIVEALHRDEDIGAIFTKPKQSESPEMGGVIQGTLATSAIFWNHSRSADILLSADWSDEKNEFGFRGVTTRKGEATHGAASPYEFHVPLIAWGPDIKMETQSQVPTGNIDLIPTILYLKGIAPPSNMNGRVIHELLRDDLSVESIEVKKDTISSNVSYPDGFYYQTKLIRFHVDKSTYFQGAYTERRTQR